MGVHFRPLRRIFTVPGTLDLRGHRRRIHRDHTGLYHARQRDLLRHFAVGAGGINHRKHLIPVRNRADRREGHADAGNGTRNDQRLTPGGFYRRHEFRVIPGVDLAFTGNILRMRRVGVDLRDKRSVRPLRDGCGGDHRDLRQGSDFCQRCRTGTQFRHWHITNGLEQTALVIDKEHHSIVHIDDRTGSIKVRRCRHVLLLYYVQSWPKRPELKSRMASLISALLFITNGP